VTAPDTVEDLLRAALLFRRAGGVVTLSEWTSLPAPAQAALVVAGDVLRGDPARDTSEDPDATERVLAASAARIGGAP